MKEIFQDKYHPVWPDASGQISQGRQSASIFENSCLLPMPKKEGMSENGQAATEKVGELVKLI